MVTGTGPDTLTIRMYGVGFGDCFLLTFGYGHELEPGRTNRNVLVDFGSTSLGGNLRSLKPIADLIRAHSGGQIDAVVISHRHRDHISAFGSPDIAKTLMAEGFPKLVVRSWTERPDIATDAHSAAAGAASAAAAGAPAAPGAAAADLGAVGSKSQDFLKTLRSAEDFAAALRAKLTDRRGKPSSRSLAGQVWNMADDQVGDVGMDDLKNAAAVRQLRAWGDQGRATYINYPTGRRKDDTGLEALLPGVNIRVLGPPTVDQHADVQTQRESDPNEFWMIYGGALSALNTSDLLGPLKSRGDEPGSVQRDTAAAPAMGSAATAAEDEAPGTARPAGPIGPVRWLTDRMGRQQLNSLLRIVRILDTVLNNTSVILLFEVPTAAGTMRMLFPGDAQIENWEYALKVARDKATNLRLLRQVDVYKVGHHGSRNATPRTLFDLWPDPATPADRTITSIMSTKGNVHGDTPETAVPRSTLKAALDTKTLLHTTEDLPDGVHYVELVADLRVGKQFTKSEIAPATTTRKPKATNPPAPPGPPPANPSPNP